VQLDHGHHVDGSGVLQRPRGDPQPHTIRGNLPFPCHPRCCSRPAEGIGDAIEVIMSRQLSPEIPDELFLMGTPTPSPPAVRGRLLDASPCGSATQVD